MSWSASGSRSGSSAVRAARAEAAELAAQLEVLSVRGGERGLQLLRSPRGGGA